MSQIIYPISDTGPVYPKLDDLPVNWDLLITPDSWTITNDVDGKSTITAITDLSSNNRAITLNTSAGNGVSTPKGNLAYSFGVNKSNTQNNFYFTRTYDTYPISFLFYVNECPQTTTNSVHKCVFAPKGPLSNFFLGSGSHEYGYFCFRYPRNGSGHSFTLYHSDNNLLGPSGRVNNITISANSYHEWSVYIAVTSENEVRLYRDGELQGTSQGPFPMPTLNATSYYYGNEPLGGRYPMNSLVASGIALEEWNEAMVKSITNSCSIY